ncbi:hypothetical protein CAPTEDRAFT_213056 [Capitella teleta]|uniref:Uncharacterized protein n=1 Tax=Capitella teleta TaxID=283909 RepID=R7VCL9_CAPTE|nr:hypothetical protein CAPTEDRAFT_213056 [Capitella teleta]|eukprot:ELU16297.1 hypothetical protein CAPTEDRAFT_213056 [Capitella teleta]
MALRHTFERKEEFNGLLAEARAVEAEFHGTASVQVRAQQVDSEKLDLILQKVTALEARVLRVEEGQRPTTKTSKCCGDRIEVAIGVGGKRGTGVSGTRTFLDAGCPLFFQFFQFPVYVIFSNKRGNPFRKTALNSLVFGNKFRSHKKGEFSDVTSWGK